MNFNYIPNLTRLSSAPGLINPAGLDRFRKSLGRVGNNSSGTGLGGVDIVVAFADSILKGTGATDYWRDGVMHKFKVLAQRYFNPSNCIGGYGFVPFTDGAATSSNGTTGSTNFQISTFTAELDYADNADGPGARYLRIYQNAIDSGASQRINLFRLDQTIADTEERKLKVDSLDLVYETDPAFGTVTIDVGTASGATPNRGAGSPTASVSQAAASTFGNRLAVTGITGKSAYTDLRICVRAPQSSTTRVSADGVILYYQDRDKGIRVHDHSNSGSASGGWSANSLAASIDPYGVGSLSGAYYAGLYVMNMLVNDAQAATNITTFRSRVGTAIDRALARSTSPSVLYTIAPRITTVAQAVYDSYVDAVYAECTSRANVSILDFYSVLGTATSGDGVHNNDLTQDQMAWMLFKAVTS